MALTKVLNFTKWMSDVMMTYLRDQTSAGKEICHSDDLKNPAIIFMGLHDRRFPVVNGLWEYGYGMMGGFLMWTPQVAFLPATLLDLYVALGIRRRVQARWASSLAIASWFFARQVCFRDVILSLSWMLTIDILGSNLSHFWGKMGMNQRLLLEEKSAEKDNTKAQGLRLQALCLYTAGFFVGMRLTHEVNQFMLERFFGALSSVIQMGGKPVLESTQPTPLVLLAPFRHFGWFQPFLPGLIPLIKLYPNLS